MTPDRFVVSALSDAFLAGKWTLEGLVRRANRVVGKGFRVRPLAKKVIRRFRRPPFAREAELRHFVTVCLGVADEFDDWAYLQERSDEFDAWAEPGAFAPEGRTVQVHRRLLVDPAPDLPPAPMPPLATPWNLASWLDVDLHTLEWLAQSRRHYRCREVPRPDGDPRVLHIPGPQLAAVQRRLGRALFAVGPIHDAAHGFRPGRSAATHAAAHAGREIVIRIDLADFFTTIHAGRVAAVLNRLGYRESVARLLARLVTVGGRLPQGAPSSPAVSNLCAWRLDRRLHGLAQSVGANYTRYADDLTFSGDRELARRAARFCTHVAAIVHDVGFTVNHRKTRVMHRGTQQRVTGLVVNAAPAVSRRERDQLRAILTNCVRHGPESQNRQGHEDFRAHLLGRVGWVAGSSVAHAIPLRALFDAIVWPT